MNKYLFTFGLDSPWNEKCVIVESDNEDKARTYVFEKYGQMNVAGVYDYYEKAYLIEKYNYEIIEEVKL